MVWACMWVFRGGATYGLLEDGGIRVRDGVADFGIGGVRTNDTVLTLSGGLRVSPEVGLKRLVAIDGGLEAAVNLADLRSVAGAARLGLRFDVLDAGDESTVSRHYLRTESSDLARGHIGAGQHLAEDALEVGELVVQLVEGAVDFTALVEDSIGVCWRGAAVVLHLEAGW